MTEDKVIIAVSRKVSDNAYGSFEATIGIESEVPAGTNKDSHRAGMWAWCQAFLDEKLGAMSKQYISNEPIARPLAEEFAEEVGGEIRLKVDLPETLPNYNAPAKEKPPTPEEMEGMPIGPGSAGEKPSSGPLPKPAPQEEVRTTVEDNQKTFRVNAFVVAETKDKRDKYLQVWGDGPWSRQWVPAWKDVAELLYDDLQSMDLGTIPPPYDIEATVEMGTWKNPKSGKTVASPNNVIEWTRIQ